MGLCVLLGLLVLASTATLAPSFDPWLLEKGPVETTPAQQTFSPPFAEAKWSQQADNYQRERWALSLKNSLQGYANTTVWLVVAAFLISGAMIHTGLGRRLALRMVATFGQTTLGLGYAIAAAEFLLAPFIPSNTARGGGVMMPMVNSISDVLGSHPHDHPRRAGEYLVLCGAHLNLVTAAMFLTGMAANPLVSKMAKEILQVDFGWGRWVLGAIVPGLVSLALVPIFLYWLARPELTDASKARATIRGELKELGPWTAQQITLAALLVAMLLFWATSPLQIDYLGFQLPTALVALGGVAAMVVLGVMPYSKVIGNAAAWDALLWLGGLVTMADALKTTGFIDWLATQIHSNIGSTTGIAAAVLLAILYFYSMYAFSMLTGHILAMAGLFFTLAAALGAPPLVMVAMIAYFSNLCGCTTNYSTGPVVLYYGLGFVPAARWFKIGLAMSLLHLAVWLGVGLAWWKVLGWW